MLVHYLDADVRASAVGETRCFIPPRAADTRRSAVLLVEQGDGGRHFRFETPVNGSFVRVFYPHEMRSLSTVTPDTVVFIEEPPAGRIPGARWLSKSGLPLWRPVRVLAQPPEDDEDRLDRYFNFGR